MILCLILFLTFTACGGPAPLQERCSEAQKEVLSSGELPEALVYNRNYGYGARYEVEDAEIIAAALDALRQIQIESEYDIVCSDADESLVFVMEDGERCAFCFNDKNLSMEENSDIYRISNDEALWDVTGRIIREYPDILDDGTIDGDGGS